MKIPTKTTLRKYGLSQFEWIRLYQHKQGRCWVCYKEPTRLVIDHQHVKGWKKMDPSERKLYVRGLLCWTCNFYFLRRGMSRNVANSISEYLEFYEQADAKLVLEGSH